MCVGGQDIPVTLRVAGGVEGGKWKSEEDVRSTPQPEEEVQTTETAETEVMEPSAPLYKPVIERIDKLSERLPEKVAEETFEEVSPMMQEGFQMADNNQMDTMQMLHRIMRNTRPRRPWQPRGPRGDGPFGKGGGHMVHPGLSQILDPDRRPLGANPQVAGLAGLFGRPKVLKPEQTTPTPYNFGFAQRNPSPENIAKFPQQQMATPMHPEVVEAQQQMEILGQPKQFAGGGIVNALMATPIGQAAIKQYAQGGEVEAQQIFEMAQTGASLEDILAGRARFFTTPRYRHAEVISDISDTLGLGTPIKKKKRIEEPYQDDAGGEPPSETDWGWAAASGPELFGNLPGGKSINPNTGKSYDADSNYDPSKVGPKSIPGTYKIGDTFIRGGETITDPKTGATIAPSGAGPHKGGKFSLSMFSIPGLIYSGMKEQDAKDAAVKEFNKNYVEPKAAAFPPGGGPTFMEPSGGAYELMTEEEKYAGAGKGGITTPGDVNLDDTRLGTLDPGQGGTFTPEEAAAKSAQTLARASTPTNIQLASITEDISTNKNKLGGFHPSQVSMVHGPRTKLGRTDDAKKKEDTSKGLISLPTTDPTKFMQFDPNLWGPIINPNTPLGALAHAQRSLQAPPLSDAMLSAIQDTPIQDVKVQDIYKQTIPEGYDYSGTTQPDIDVQTQVDTFSDIGDDDGQSVGGEGVTDEDDPL